MVQLIQTFWEMVKYQKKVPKKGLRYPCIACISIDSAMKVDKKSYPQVCLEECKYFTGRNFRVFAFFGRFRENFSSRKKSFTQFVKVYPVKVF